MPPAPANSELISACQVLFGRGGSFSPGFLSSLHPEGLKSTFREKALLTHPDRAAALGKDPIRLEREFRLVVDAYRILSAHLKQRPVPAGSRPPRPAKPAAARPQPGREAPPRARAKAQANPRPPRPAAPAGPAPKSGNASARPARAVSRFWKGPLPQRRLKLGQFLFFSGAIPARELLDAVFWQRGQRPSFGQIAREWGILTPAQIAHVLARKLPAEAFGECATRLGYMTPFEKHAIACKQKNLQRPLGHYFAERGLLDPTGVERAVRLQQAHNQRFFG